MSRVSRTRAAALLAVAAALWPSPAQGRTAAFTGSGTSDWKGHRCGENYCAQGNILTGPEVVQAMTASFESSSGMLADRLLAALDAAQPAGGDARGDPEFKRLIGQP